MVWNVKINLLITGIVCVMVILYGILVYQIYDNSKLINWIVLLTMLLVFVIIAVSWIKLVPTKQVSDFKQFWNRSNAVINGHQLFYSENSYFAKYAYQTGFLLYMLSVVKIFGSNLFVMQLLNVLVQTLILLMTYLLTINVFNNVKLARLSVLLLMVDLDWFALNSQADNQYLGALFYLITFYLLQKKKTWSYLLAGLTLSIGWLVRPIGPAIFIGVMIYILLFDIEYRPQKTIHEITKKVIFPSVICFSTLFMAGQMIQVTGLNPHGLKNMNSEWKFIAGLNYESSGSYSAKLDKQFKSAPTRIEMKKQEREVLKQELVSLKQGHNWLKLIIAKVSMLWSGRTMTTNFAGFGKNHSQNSDYIVGLVGYLGSFLLIIFSWIGSLKMLKERYSSKIFMMLLPLLVFAAIELIIEVQGRYRIEFLPIISMVAGLGMYSSLSFLYSFVMSRITLLRNKKRPDMFPHPIQKI
ncbi:ArnT family glycosyltransferase [Companilactobacillus sp.]|uniref:ArnT family glycosyltransferase n=1 Tax=Companilactobacillus sp. TaxID=2767905 RepID=UPI0025C4FB54|nr:hypothetical protein [Companilactobacillus sp.]MCH4009142.1 glycosyltransferase family 39 protein [Companilactobacillus sp.]MCH4050679.1 glycosyltransferase family 39 protein [Companilactobacillus sp.]MCH4077084.1 glycosyltransferase family 39 protein [Companilactobacillus sp.]MCH4125660.1 glycosyltransferase family 39 protein [Companilactobacillus sp.]MCI1311369.1 glycosyltransferase family 39 protein [Companilactobacillus sp.]